MAVTVVYYRQLIITLLRKKWPRKSLGAFRITSMCFQKKSTYLCFWISSRFFQNYFRRFQNYFYLLLEKKYLLVLLDFFQTLLELLQALLELLLCAFTKNTNWCFYISSRHFQNFFRRFRILLGGIRIISRYFQIYFQTLLELLLGTFRITSRRFQNYFWAFLELLLGAFRITSRRFQNYFQALLELLLGAFRITSRHFYNYCTSRRSFSQG